MARTLTTAQRIFMAALAAVFFAGFAGAEEVKPSEPPAEKDLVALVNGEPISSSQVDREMTGYQQRLIRSGQALTPDHLADLRAKVVENLIDRSLLYQESVREGIEVTDEEVQEQWSAIRERFTSDEAYEIALKRMQMNEKDLRDEIRQGRAVQKLIGKLFSKSAEISEAEAQTFYDSHPEAFMRPEQVRASHILIQTDPEGGDKAEQEAVSKLEGIRKEVLAGKDFAGLAREHSQCPSREQGGDLGFFSRGKMAKPFEDAAFALKPGEVSGVVKTQFGYHLIKQEEQRPEGLVPFVEVRDRVRDHLGQEAVREAVQSHVKQLRNEAEIQRFDRVDEKSQ